MAFLEDVAIPKEVKDELLEILRYRFMQQAHQARKEQEAAQRFGGERYALDFGRVDLMVHPFFYHYWGQRLGYECWQNDEFVREFKRDNETVRVKSRARQLKVGFVGGCDLKPGQSVDAGRLARFWRKGKQRKGTGFGVQEKRQNLTQPAAQGRRGAGEVCAR